MFSTKKAIAITGAAAMIFAIAACGGSNTGNGSSGGKLSGEITFQTWNLKNAKYTPYFTNLINTYQKEHPGTTIKWIDQPSDGYEQKLSADAAAGQLPDVMDAGPSMFYGLAKAGALLNISTEAPNAKNGFYPGAWSAVTFKGNGVQEGAYGFPWYVNDGPMYYNTKLMKQCGLDPNKLPVSWDDYFTQAKTAVKNCKGVYMSTMIGGSIDDLASAGVQVMNAAHTKYTFNSDTAVAQLQNFVDLYKAGGIPPEALSAQWSQQADFFQRGSIIGMGGSAYSADGFKQNAPDLYNNLTVGTKLSNEGKSASVSYEMLALSATTKNKALALDFAQYVTNSKNQLEFDKKSSTFPSSKGTLDDPYFANATKGSDINSRALKITLESVKNGYSSRPAEFTDMNGAQYLQQQAALALEGKQTAKQALDKAVKFANDKLAQ